MIDLEDVRAFVEVAETGGFARAGRNLSLSTSMVSRRLDRLEAELNARLFTRSTRGVALTEAGQNFRPYADRVLADLEAARDAVSQEGDEITGVLRIAAPLSFGTMHLAPVLAELAIRHPRLSIDTDYSDRLVNLIAERFDVAIRVGALPDSSLIARKIAPIHAALVASPAYLARAGEPRTLKDLEAHEAVLQHGAAWRFPEGAGDISARMRVRFRANAGEPVARAAEAGLGITALPTFLTGEAIAAGRLVRILPDVKFPDLGLYVVRAPPAGHTPAKIRALNELMVEKFGGEPHWDVMCTKARN
jgi:DNA-binding transcriptional LysR family regulator